MIVGDEMIHEKRKEQQTNRDRLSSRENLKICFELIGLLAGYRQFRVMMRTLRHSPAAAWITNNASKAKRTLPEPMS